MLNVDIDQRFYARKKLKINIAFTPLLENEA